MGFIFRRQTFGKLVTSEVAAAKHRGFGRSVCGEDRGRYTLRVMDGDSFDPIFLDLAFGQRGSNWPPGSNSPKPVLPPERLQKNRGIPIADFPVPRQAPGNGVQDSRGQMARGNPRQVKKAGVINDQGKVSFPLFGCPADELIARGRRPRRRSKTQGRQKMQIGERQISTGGMPARSAGMSSITRPHPSINPGWRCVWACDPSAVGITRDM